MEFSGPASVSELNSTFGVLFVGFVLAVSLYGLTFFQTYVFFAHFPNESPWTKRTVGLLWMIDTATTAMVSHIQYRYLITDFLLSFEQLQVTKTFVIERILATVAIFLVQGFYGVRIWYSTNGIPVLPVAIGFFAAGSFGLGIVSTVQLMQREMIANLVDPSLKIIVGVQEGLSAICSIIIVVTMFVSQRETAHVGHAKRGEDILERWAVKAVNRGTSFTAVQIALLVTFLTVPHSQVWILFHFIVSKAYINSLLAMLNSRKASHGRGIYDDGSQSKSYSTHTGSQLTSGIVFQQGRSTMGTASFDAVGSNDALTVNSRSGKDTIDVIEEEDMGSEDEVHTRLEENLGSSVPTTTATTST